MRHSSPPRLAVRHAVPRTAALLMLAVLVMLAGCGSDPVGNTPVEGVQVSPPNPTVRLGETLRLTATVNVDVPEGGSRQVHWSSADPAIATVDANGVVTPHAVGTVQVAASAGGQSDVVAVQVLGYAVHAVVLTASTAQLAVGDTVQLTSAVAAANGVPLPDRPVVLSNLDPTVVRLLADGSVVGLSAGTARIVAASEGVSDTTTLMVGAAVVATVELAPGIVGLRVGESRQLTVVARDRLSNVLGGRATTFTSSAPAVATVDGQGVVTGVAPGAATITATVEGVSATAAITVSNIPVATVTLAPAIVELVVGETGQLSAVARDADDNELEGRAVTFSSSAPSVVTVDQQGRVTGVALGIATITATSEGRTATAAVSVRPPSVATVQLTPATMQLAVGATGQLTTVAQDANGAPVTGRTVMYTSSAPARATVSSEGLVTAVAPGNVTITASVEGRTATATVSVSAIPVATVEVVPSTVALTVGGTRQLSVVARDAGGNVLTGRTASYASSAPGVATVSGAGLVTAVAAGTTTITATVGGRTGRATVTVSAVPVATVTITPAVASLTIGSTQQLSTVARDAAGNVLTGRAVAYASGAPAVATVSASGRVTAVAPGSATIAATVEGKTGTAVITVSLVAVASVELTPSTAALAVGATQQLSAVARDAAGNALTGRPVTFVSSAPGVATVSSTGLVTAVAAGSATITATVEGKTATAVVTVSQIPVASVELTPATASLTVGATQQLSAVARDAAGNVLAGRVATYASSAPAVATVSESGLVTAVAPGSATIAATVEGRTGFATITVSQVPVASVELTPTTAALTVGATQQLSAVARDGAGNALTGRPVTYASSAPAVATVSSTGLVTGVAAGSATITATVEGATATAAISVSPVAVASVELTPPTLELRPGQSGQLTAVARDAAGNALTDRPVSYASGAPDIATVSTSGLVTAVAPGSATITATVEGIEATSTVTVLPAPVAAVEVTPATVELTEGGTQQLSIVVRDEAGNVLTGRPVSYASSASGVATVSSTGLVTAVAAGSATITVTVESVSATAAVTVVAAEPPPDPPGPAARVELVSGSLQIGPRGGVLAFPLIVRVVDAGGRPVPGVTVEWEASRGGSLEPATVVTDANGRASVRWRLGQAPGSQEAIARVNGAGSASFWALAIGGDE